MYCSVESNKDKEDTTRFDNLNEMSAIDAIELGKLINHLASKSSNNVVCSADNHKEKVGMLSSSCKGTSKECKKSSCELVVTSNEETTENIKILLN